MRSDPLLVPRLIAVLADNPEVVGAITFATVIDQSVRDNA